MASWCWDRFGFSKGRSGQLWADGAVFFFLEERASVFTNARGEGGIIKVSGSYPQ